MSAANGAAWDSNGDGDYVDSNDTPAGEDPNWDDDKTKIIILVTDADFHAGDEGSGWPGPTEAETITALNDAGIHVIVLATESYSGVYNGIAAATGGSVKLIDDSSSNIVDALMAALEEIRTDVWYEIGDCPDVLDVSISPEVHYDVLGDSTVVFTETITVDWDAVPGTYTCEVEFWSNTYPAEGESVGVQEIIVHVDPVPVDIDIKPWSWPNSINRKSKGVVPVAILGSETFDVMTVDPTTVTFGWTPAYPGWNYPSHDMSDPDVYNDHLVYPYLYDPTPDEPASGDEYMRTANMDSFVDLVFHFNQKECYFIPSDEYGYLTGQLDTGQWFMGWDYVRILK
jgi:hypothetical protein